MSTKVGTNNNDKIYGTQSADVLTGKGGDDYLSGAGGNDTLYGNDGADKLDGGAGNDKLYGGAGIDFLGGGDGADLLYGEDGDDYLTGGKGFDQLFGGNGNDRLLGGEGTNSVDGGAGNDTIVWEQYGICADQGSTLKGGNGTDTLHIIAPGQIATDQTSESFDHAIAAVYMSESGSTGSIHFVCGRQEVSNEIFQGDISGFEKITVGANTMLDYSGGSSSMTVAGGAMDDLISFGSGNEYVSGGAGHDIFMFNMWDNKSKGHDVIYGFNPTQDNFVLLGASPYDDRDLNFTQVEKNGNTYITATDHAGHQVIDLTLMGATGLQPDILKYTQDWWG